MVKVSCNWSDDVRPITQLDRPVSTVRMVPGHFVCALVGGSEVCGVCGRGYEAMPKQPPREPDLGDAESCPSEWFIDGKEPNNWRAHRLALVAVNRKQYVTLDAVKRFLKSGVSWDELVRSELLGIYPISGVTRLGASCSKGHALRDPRKPCHMCAKERVRKYREKRRKMIST